MDRLADISIDEVRRYAEQLNLNATDKESSKFASVINAGLGRYAEIRKQTAAETRTVFGGPEALVFDPDEDNDPLNAYISLFSLEASDHPYTELTGLKVGIKDNIAVAGVPMTCGSDVFEGLVPFENATVVNRLLAQGARLTGKTNMDELALGVGTSEHSKYGPVANPSDENHVAGGSSSGSAAAVGAGDADAALGSDTGGSVRLPAAFCGLVGLKPTWDVIPRFGFIELAYTLDSIGVIAPDIETTALVFAATVMDHTTGTIHPLLETRQYQIGEELAGASVGEMNIGVIEECLHEYVSDEVLEGFNSCLEQLEQEGATVERVSIPRVLELHNISSAIINIELATMFRSRGIPIRRRVNCDVGWQRAMSACMVTFGHQFGNLVRRKAIEGTYLLDRYGGTPYVLARKSAYQLQNEINKALEDYDVLFSPTVPVTAPRFGEWSDEGYTSEDVPMPMERLIRATRPANVAGHPALTVPIGCPEGLPVGGQLMAEKYDDFELLRMGKAVEEVLRAS